MSQRTEMIYDDVYHQWVADLDGRAYRLHCGECFELVIGPHSIPCSLELDSHWFIIMQDVRMNLRVQSRYQVIL